MTITEGKQIENADNRQPGSDTHTHVTVADVLASVYRDRMRVLAVAAIVFALSTVLAFAMRDRYTATASFIPPNTSVSGASAVAGQLAQLSGFGSLLGNKSSGDLYIGILRSRTMLDRIISRFHMLPVYRVKNLSAAEGQLLGRSEFGVDFRTSIVYISFTDHDPNRAREVVDAYCQELQQITANLALTESSQRRLFFEQHLKEEQNALAGAEVALKQNRERSGLIVPGGQTNTGIQAIASLRGEIASRRVRLASLLHDETEQNPDVQRLRSEIANLEGQVFQMENGKTGGPSGAISSVQMPGLELEYGRLAREVKYHESLIEIMSRQYEAARLDEAHDAPLQLLDRPRTPDAPSGPARPFIMLSGLVAGLLTGSLFVVFHRYFWAAGSPRLADRPNPQLVPEDEVL